MEAPKDHIPPEPEPEPEPAPESLAGIVDVVGAAPPTPPPGGVAISYRPYEASIPFALVPAEGAPPASVPPPPPFEPPPSVVRTSIVVRIEAWGRTYFRDSPFGF